MEDKQIIICIIQQIIIGEYKIYRYTAGSSVEKDIDYLNKSLNKARTLFGTDYYCWIAKQQFGIVEKDSNTAVSFDDREYGILHYYNGARDIWNTEMISDNDGTEKALANTSSCHLTPVVTLNKQTAISNGAGTENNPWQLSY